MARYDITEEIVSDSGLQFRSNEFKAFAKELRSQTHTYWNG